MTASRRNSINVFDLANCGGWAAGITGARGTELKPDRTLQHLREIGERLRVTTQIFDAQSIAGPIHLIHAARGAALAFKSKRLHARSLDLEILCWVAGERQIKVALEKVGVKPHTHEFALVSLGRDRKKIRTALIQALKKLQLHGAPEVLKLSPQKIPKLCKIFNVGKVELKTAPVENLVLERIALLSTL